AAFKKKIHIKSIIYPLKTSLFLYAKLEYCIRYERRVKQNVFSHARAFAGGSCKNIWCFSYPECPVLCRNPDKARPSMSGFGINVMKLMQSAGWNSEKAKISHNDADNISWLAGLILL
ncbi:MAG: hypothetical protein HQK73_08530, partial [Desulfamplus sp.]|nr:hypothetical protein [Desulfamplus sp.]